MRYASSVIKAISVILIGILFTLFLMYASGFGEDGNLAQNQQVQNLKKDRNCGLFLLSKQKILLEIKTHLLYNITTGNNAIIYCKNKHFVGKGDGQIVSDRRQDRSSHAWCRDHR